MESVSGRECGNLITFDFEIVFLFYLIRICICLRHIYISAHQGISYGNGKLWSKVVVYDISGRSALERAPPLPLSLVSDCACNLKNQSSSLSSACSSGRSSVSPSLAEFSSPLQATSATALSGMGTESSRAAFIICDVSGADFLSMESRIM